MAFSRKRKTVLPQNKMEDNVIEIDIFDLLKVSNGRDKDNMPKSAGALTLIESDFLTKELTDEEAEKLTESDIRKLKEIVISTSEINTYISGGCAVVELNMPLQERSAYRRIMRVCEDWFKNLDDERYDNQMLSFTLVPLILKGELTLAFQGMVYYFGIKAEDTYKVIMCFDNHYTEGFDVEGINYEEIKKRVEEELRMEEELLEKEILETEADIKRLKDKQNPFAQTISEQYSMDNLTASKDDEDEDNTEAGTRRRGIRVSKDE